MFFERGLGGLFHIFRGGHVHNFDRHFASTAEIGLRFVQQNFIAIP